MPNFSMDQGDVSQIVKRGIELIFDAPYHWFIILNINGLKQHL